MSDQIIQDALLALPAFKADLYEKDFLLTWEHPDNEIAAILVLAECFKLLHKNGKSLRSFDAGLAISIFRDNSTRTRFSFASAVSALGLNLSELDEAKSQVAHGETLRETAHMISFMLEAIGIRDDIYLGEGHAGMQAFGAALTEGARDGVLPRRPSIINLQSDLDHPTQTLADLAWLKKHFGGLSQLKGKKLAMTWAYSPSYGKPLSVPQGVIALMTRFGMEVTLAHPEGYGLIPEVVKRSAAQAFQSGGRFQVTNSMEEAFEGADIVYPKSWASFEVMERRTELLHKKDREALISLEKEGLAQNARFENWTCDAARMALTQNGNGLYMHCLPADISGVSCEKGEVSKEVFEAHRLGTYWQASYKPFVIAAILFLTRMKNPSESLKKLIADRA